MAAPQSPWLPLRIARARDVADCIREFELRSADGGELPEFTAGAHISIQTPNDLVRKYSLANDPEERDRYVIVVLREESGRGGSKSLVEETKEGDEILVSPPRNNFPLVRSPAGYLFIAGGIGITPVMSMVRQLKRSEGAKFKLCYCTRSPRVTAFREELAGPQFRGQVTIHHDGGDPARMLDLWPFLEQPKGHVYCCGPRRMMQDVRDMTGHWSSSAVHFEAFSEPEKNAPNDRPFRVRLARSSETVEVPVGTTILEAIRAAGHEAPSSCESGTCGTCRTTLLAGEADHRDLVLGDHEKASNIMICVSRARSDELVIDR
jgi:phthalate 4,5-dioxygenase reductase subunit